MEGRLKNSKIYLCKTEMIKVDGYWDDDVIETISFAAANEIQIITIGENQRILLTGYSELKFYLDEKQK